MCVESECTHPSYNDKNPPSGFVKITILKSPFEIRLFWDSCQNDVVLYRPLHDSWLTRPSYLRPDHEWAESCAIVSTPVQGKTRCLRLIDLSVYLLDLIMNIAVVIYSWHLSRWRVRGWTILSLWSECADPDYINASMFARIIRDPALSTEEVSIGFLWIFANRLS